MGIKGSCTVIEAIVSTIIALRSSGTEISRDLDILPDSGNNERKVKSGTMLDFREQP